MGDFRPRGGSRGGFNRGNRGGFNRDRSSGGFGGRSFGGGRFGDRDSRRAEMHDVVCDKCGKNCQVPFKPTEGKQVLCSDCFKQSGGGSSRNQGQSMSSDQFKSINSKLDKILLVLEGLELVPEGEEDSDELDDDLDDDEDDDEDDKSNDSTDVESDA